MKTRNYLLSVVLGLIAFAGYVQANDADPLVFVSIPEIPSSIQTNANPSCYPYVIKNKLSTDSLPLDISLVPNTDPRISINHTITSFCPIATDCGDKLKPGHECTIVVEVDPSQDATPSQSTETLTIEYSPRYNPLESNIVIDFVLPPPAVLQFSVLADPPAQVIIGASAQDFTYTIQNIGAQTATDIVPAVVQRQPVPESCMPPLVDFVSSTCEDSSGDVSQPYQLLPGATCNLTYSVQALTTTPADCDLNIQNEYTLQIAYDGIGSPLQSNIDFYVVQPAAFLNFESFPDNLPPAVIEGTTSEMFTYVIENYGSSDADIGTIANITTPTPTNPIVVATSDLCSNTTLASGDTCSITYELDATDNPTARFYTNILSIPYNNPTASPLQTEYGFAVAESAVILSLTLTSGPITPIQIPGTEVVTYTLSNLGNVDAENLNPTIDIDYGFIALTGGTCPNTPDFTLTAGTSCTLQYTITPVVVGTSSQELTVSYDITPGNPAVASSDIDFYAYTATPLNAYVAISNLSLGFPFVPIGGVQECPIDTLDGSLETCGSLVNVSGVTSLDFTTGNYAFTSAYHQPLYLNDKVQRCTASVFGNCHTTANYSSANAYYGSFIKFYTPTLAYLSNFQTPLLIPSASDTVQLCTVNPSANTISCGTNAWGTNHIPGPTAIGLLKFNSTDQYAYILNKSTNSLLLCAINTTNGTFTSCGDSGAGHLFQFSGTLDFISSGEMNVYVPFQVSINQADILQCQLNENGLLSGCVSVKSFNDPSVLNLVVSGIKVFSVGGSTGNPVAYIGYSDGPNNYVISCPILPNGGFDSCSTRTSFSQLIQGINVL